jgi:hypothetical protein
MRSIGIASTAILVTFLIAGPVLAQGNIAVHVGGATVKDVSREVCAQKAIRILANEKFLYAEVDKEGHAWGYSDKASVVILCFSNPVGAAFIVCAASGDSKEAERLRNVIRSQLGEVPHDPKLPTHLGALDSKQKSKVPQFRWHVARHGFAATLRFFEAGASIASEKLGMNAGYAEKTLVLTSGQGGVAATFAAPGSNALSVNLGVAVASWDDALSERLAKSLERALVQILYE